MRAAMIGWLIDYYSIKRKLLVDYPLIVIFQAKIPNFYGSNFSKNFLILRSDIMKKQVNLVGFCQLCEAVDQ